MDHKTMRTDWGHHDTGLDLMDRTSVFPEDPHFQIKSEQVMDGESESLHEMHPTVKLEVYPEAPTTIEFGNEAVPKLESFEENIMPTPTGKSEVNDNETLVQSQAGPSLPVADSHRKTCPYCAFSSESDSLYEVTNSMELHHVRYHPEHFFPSEKRKVKAAGLAVGNLQRILVDNIFPRFFLKSGNIASCCLCFWEYSSGSLASNCDRMRKHLVCTHQKRLKKELEPILKIQLRKLRRSKAIMETKIVMSFGNQNLEIENDITGANGFMYNSPLRVLKKSYSNTRNTNCVSPDWMSTLTEANSSNAHFDLNEGMDESESPIETKFENEDVKHDPLGDAALQSYEMEAKRSDELQCQPVSRQPKCTYCGHLFPSGNPVRLSNARERHLIQHHPHHYFLAEEDAALSSGWTLEEFQRIFVDNLLPQPILKNGKLWSCSLCSHKTCRDRYRIQHHLISAHNMQMKERIRKVLSEGPINTGGDVRMEIKVLRLVKFQGTDCDVDHP